MRLRKWMAQALLVGALAAGLAPAAWAQTIDGTFTIGTSTSTVTEGDDITITFTRDTSDLDLSRTIAIQTSGGAAFGIADATRNHVLTWGTGQAVSVTFPTTDDAVDEANATVTFTLLANPLGNAQSDYGIGTPASVTVTVQDNDESPELSLSATDTDVTEGEPITITVSRTSASPDAGFSGDLKLRLAGGARFGTFAADGTSSLADGAFTQPGFTLAAGGTGSATFTIATDNDRVDDIDAANDPECDDWPVLASANCDSYPRFQVTLERGNGYTVGSPAFVKIAIRDNDRIAQPPSVERVTATANTLVVDWLADADTGHTDPAVMDHTEDNPPITSYDLRWITANQVVNPDILSFKNQSSLWEGRANVQAGSTTYTITEFPSTDDGSGTLRSGHSFYLQVATVTDAGRSEWSRHRLETTCPAAGENPPAPDVDDQDGTEGAPFSYEFGRVASDGCGVVYSATLGDGSELPEWLTFDARTRTFSGTPADADTPAALCVKVTATVSGTAQAASSTFMVNVPEDAPPPAPAVADQTTPQDAAFTYTVPAVTDPDGDTVTYSAAQPDGGELPGWLSFDSATRAFSGTPGEDDRGSTTIRVTVAAGGKEAHADFTLTVGSCDDGIPCIESINLGRDPDRSPPSGEAFAHGDVIWVEVDFDDQVEVTRAPDTLAWPCIELTIGDIRKCTQSLSLAHFGDPSKSKILLEYTVQGGDEDTDGVSVAANSIKLNGGRITTRLHGSDVPDPFFVADLSHPAVNDDASLKVSALTVVHSVEFTPQPANGDTYVAGEDIEVKIRFNTAVNITGTPKLDLEIGARTRVATCPSLSSFSGGAIMTCSYEVQPGDVDDQGVSLFPNALFLDGGATITTANGRDAFLLIENPPTGPKVDGGSLSPELETFRFDILSKPETGDTFRAGETIRVLAIYYPEVDVGGTPRVPLTIGSRTRYATFVPFGGVGSDRNVPTRGETWLYFEYAVQPGDLDEDGISVEAAPNTNHVIDLNGGSITGVVRGHDTGADLAHNDGAGIATDPTRKVNGGPASVGGGGGGSGGTNSPPSTGGGEGTSSPPAVQTQLKPQTVPAGATKEMDLRGAFRNARSFSAASSEPATASVETTSGGSLRVTGRERGVATVTVTAAGANGAEASQTVEVTVTGPARVLLLPPAGDELGRQGFVRIINHGDAAGEVAVEAFDDTGRSAGKVTVPLPANGAAHFNTTDLEDGNPAKGIDEGVGPGLGGWRLVLNSDLAFTALGYVRTRDGFLTAMHDAAPADGDIRRIAFINPASNWNQVSALRLVNPGPDDAAVTVTGVDDAGRAPPASVEFDVLAGAAVQLTADELEARLGDGAGKWRLEAASEGPVAAMSLLESPTGHLTNLSTIPRRPDNGRHVVPFLPPASDPHGRQGFVRVANRSGRDGTATIRAFDDAGTDYGTLTLSLGARRTTNFNTHDLEVGNSDKGLTGSTGPAVARGWRLELASDLELDVLAYVRHPDGFVTAMHDVAPAGREGPWVAFLNPASNWRQVSLLRLVNSGAEDARVTLTGTDDAGAPGRRSVYVTVPAGTSRTLSSVDLEDGAEGLRGAFGDGKGKWRVRVASRMPVLVMSLLESPTGHLTNLSTAPQRGAL